MGKTTDFLDKTLKDSKRLPDYNYIDDTAEERAKISKDIQDKFQSINNFAKLHAMSASHLNEFLNGKKNVSRDHLLIIFIELNYSEDTINSYLKRFGETPLYSRKKRDAIIKIGLQNDLSLDEINAELEREGQDLLWIGKD